MMKRRRPKASIPSRRRPHGSGWLGLCALLLALAGLAAGAAPQDAGEDAPASEKEVLGEPAADRVEGEIFHVKVDSIIHPVVAEFLQDTLKKADDAKAAAVVIELSTPGGLATSMREIFSAMLEAETPVVVYVSPSGAQAASAGFFILMAADVAAMAPGTNTGAAAVVGGQGEDIEGKMGEKVQQDAAATIRSLAERRGRNVELAESAVLEARSFSAVEALENNLIDLISPSLTSLLAEIDGRKIEKDEEEIVLATAEAPLHEVKMSAVQRFLAAIAHPNIAYLLLSLGGLGLYFELSNPGAVFPGVVGTICLILAFFALSVLPVNYAGMALMGLAVLFFIAEIKVHSFGLLTVGGVVCLVLGSLMLFKTVDPALQVSRELIAALAAAAAVLVAFLVFLVGRAFRRPVTTGAEGMTIKTGVARSDLDPRGRVNVHGEIWEAVADRRVEKGERVEVVAMDGMLLRVRRVEPEVFSPASGVPPPQPPDPEGSKA